LARVVALIPCAGQGKRMGAGVSKPYLEVYGRPLLAYTLETFQKHPLIEGIILVVEAGAVSYCCEEIVDKYGFTKVKSVVVGGKERQDSVMCGLAYLDKDTEWIAVHDGARPLISGDIITRALHTAFEADAAVVGVRVKDTIKVVGQDLTIIETPDRHKLWQIQTPQIFRRQLLERAYIQAAQEGWLGTDDASFVERLGQKIRMVEGEYLNIKITTPDDLIYFKAMLKGED